MNRISSVLLSIVLLGIATVSRSEERQPEHLTLSLVWVADAGEPHQYIYAINALVGYRTLEGLKEHLRRLPRNSTLTWNPGCERFGDEPLLNSAEEMQRFRDFCEKHGIKFILVPSG